MNEQRSFIPIPLDVVLDEFIEKLSKSQSTPKYPTGFKILDELTWGLPESGVVVIGARTSEGKSAFSLNLASSLTAMGHSVCYFSHEDTRHHLMQRYLCLMTNIKYYEFRSSPNATIQKLNIEKHKRFFNNIDFLIIDEFGITFDEVEFAISNLDPMPSIIIIDYIQLIKSNKAHNRKDIIDHFMRSVKSLANQLGIVIIVVSQMNRTVENMRPQIWQLKESGAIEEASDLIFLLHYPYKYDLLAGKDSDFSQNLIECIIAKNKNGPIGHCDLFFDPDTFRFKAWCLSEHGHARKPD